MNNRKSGSLAEDRAAEFLLSSGYQIKDRNYHAGRLGEIDIICETRTHTVFVEVKSSQVDDFGNPVYKVGIKKQQQIALIAEIYLAHHPSNKDCRFDVIVLEGQQLIHYVDAFRR
ncbi:MAG: YraN family protein [Calditrichaeota bacterium]|nr:YraN family protein [Calditrichota bacterium]